MTDADDVRGPCPFCGAELPQVYMYREGLRWYCRSDDACDRRYNRRLKEQTP